MGRHITQVVPVAGDRWIATCSCRWRSNDTLLNPQQGEDEIYKHNAQVERARASARRGTPSLQDQRDHFRKMAGEDADPTSVALWERLASELDHRLNEAGASDDTQEPLF